MLSSQHCPLCRSKLSSTDDDVDRLQLVLTSSAVRGGGMTEERFSFHFCVLFQAGCWSVQSDSKKKKQKQVFHCGLSVSVAVNWTFQTFFFFFCSSSPESSLIHCSARPAVPPAGYQVQFLAAVCSSGLWTSGGTKWDLIGCKYSVCDASLRYLTAALCCVVGFTNKAWSLWLFLILYK